MAWTRDKIADGFLTILLVWLGFASTWLMISLSVLIIRKTPELWWQ